MHGSYEAGKLRSVLVIDRVTIVIMAAKREGEGEGKGESRQKEEHLGDLERSRNETTTKTMVRSTSKYVAASLALALALAMAAGASAQDYEEYDYEVLPEVPQEFADSMKEYAEEDTGACDPIPALCGTPPCATGRTRTARGGGRASPATRGRGGRHRPELC